MQKTAVIFFSRYGTTERYARALAQELGADVFDGARVSVAQLVPYDALVWGSGLIAGRLTGLAQMKKHIPQLSTKRQYLYLLGMAPTTDAEYYQRATRENFPPETARHITRFYFVQGDIDQRKLSFMHRLVMRMVAGGIKKKPEAERTAQDNALLTPDGVTENYDPAQLRELVEDVTEDNRAANTAAI